MNNIPMKFDYSKTLNEQLPTFEYYKNRYCSYGLQISQLQQENQQLKGRINKAIEYIEKCNPDVDLHSMFLNESYISNYGACELLEILKEVE